MRLEIRGAESLAALSRKLRAEGEAGKGLRRELFRNIQRSTKPLKAEAISFAARELPQRGGLAATVASAKTTTKTRSGGKNVGVRIEASGKYLRSTDRGFIRGTQRVTPGWFTRTMTESAPDVRREILDAMRAVTRRLS